MYDIIYIDNLWKGYKMNEHPKEASNEVDENIWTYGKSIAHLDSSENSMDDDRKEIIKQALGLDIIDIRTYSGYKGDLLVEITTMDPSVIASIKHIASTLSMETVMHEDLLSIFKIYCISASHEGYDLK